MATITISNVIAVKTEILLCSSWLNVPTVPYMMQPTLMWYTSCNIQYNVKQHSQYIIQWSVHWKSTFPHFYLANTANLQHFSLDVIMKWMEAIVVLSQKR